MKKIWWNFPDSESNRIKELSSLNDTIITISIIILSSILIITWTIKKKINFINTLENNKLEIIWTITPLFILITIIIPAIYTLYSLEENQKTISNIKINASQWFWTYEYPIIKSNETNRYIEKKKKFLIRCLSSSNPLIIPSLIPINILISRRDVIHSFSINSIGIKIDAIPGRINISVIETKKSGFLTGQCSEICGIHHRFIPININSTNIKFLN